jgi:ribosomal protein S18 acetylase RimI-like enzyme
MIEEEINVRNVEPSDYARIISVMPDWWGGRDLTALLPELFLVHFCDTSFVVEQGSELIGFLVGFMSQSRQSEAYIHFVGVHPDFRKEGIGATLYERFFEICRKRNRSIVRACTSPVNTGSVAFHARMGFQVEPGDKKVLFSKHLEE